MEDEKGIRMEDGKESTEEFIGHGETPRQTYKIASVTTRGDQIIRYSTTTGRNVIPEEARIDLRRHNFTFGSSNFLEGDFFKDNINDLSPENRAIFDTIPRTTE